MKPLLAYYGGKQKMVKNILPLLPPHQHYCEPFFGGGAVLFAKDRPSRVGGHLYTESINDISEELINVYRVMQCPRKAGRLIRRLEYTPFSQAEYHRARHITDTDDVTRAWAYYVTSQQGFAHKINGGWSCSKKKNQPRAWRNRKSNLREYLARLAGVQIFCEPASRLIERLDAVETFFYCDPPYPGTNQGHYKGYTIADFKNLVEQLETIKGSFLLSNYNQEITMPDKWEKFEFRAVSSANKDKTANKERTEVVWRYINDHARSMMEQSKQINFAL